MIALVIFPGSTDSTQPSARISAARSAMTDAAPVGVRMADGRCGSRGQLVRVTGGNRSLDDGGGTPIMIHDEVIHGVTGPGRGHGEKGPVLELFGLKCGLKRSNRGFLLAITGIIAS